jgi:energy-coupling factor transport system substrate-specific component
MTSVTAGASGWRVVDIVVAAVLGVVFGVVFWQWGVLTLPLFPLAGVNPPAYLVSGVWLIPAVLAMLLIRKPGAALFSEAVAGAVSAFLGSIWGLDTVLSGVAQGAGAELVFALFAYRSFGLPVAALASIGAAVGEWVHDMWFYWAEVAFDVQLAYGFFMLISAVGFAGIGSWLLVRALARTGVLSAFPSGREQPEI